MSYRDSSTVYGFPDRLRDAIYIKNNLNASQVADALAVDRKTVAGYLDGERTPNLVIFARMCSFLKVSPNWLLTGKE